MPEVPTDIPDLGRSQGAQSEVREVTAAQFEDREGRDLVEAIHARKAFDYDAPLPDLHIRKARSWEPAARHYRDIEPEAPTHPTRTGTL